MGWRRAIVTLGAGIAVGGAPNAAWAATAAGRAPAKPSLQLLLSRNSLLAGEIVRVRLISDTPDMIRFTNCFVLQLREPRAWKTVNSTHDGVSCARGDSASAGAYAQLEERLVLPHALQPGHYRITLGYELVPKDSGTESLHGQLHAAQTAIALLTVRPGPEPRLPESRIKQIALSTAAMNGDAHPYLVQHAAGTEDLADWIASRAFVNNATWSYLIAIRGRFAGRCASSRAACMSSPDSFSYGYLDDRPSALESVITLVINAKTARVEGFGSGDVYPDLAGLGPVTTDYRHR
jgi:hypothetical protein